MSDPTKQELRDIQRLVEAVLTGSSTINGPLVALSDAVMRLEALIAAASPTSETPAWDRLVFERIVADHLSTFAHPSPADPRGKRGAYLAKAKIIVDNLLDAFPTRPTSETPPAHVLDPKMRVAWMVEQQHNSSGASWFCAGEDRWTKDSNAAIQFPSNAAAVEVVEKLWGKTPPFEFGSVGDWENDRVCVTEHGFMSGPPTSETPPQDETPNLLKAAQKVLAGLNARIESAPHDAVPIFEGIGDLHAAIAEALEPSETPSAQRVAYLEAALRKIAKKEGRFSLDQLTFASNTVDAMAFVASEALEGTWEEASND